MYRYYGLRHPAAIFARTFTDVLKCFILLYKKVNNLQAVPDHCFESDREELASLTQIFFGSLFKYFESGYEEFLCFCPPEARPGPNEPLHKWFAEKSYRACVKPYFANTNQYLQRYRKVMNALKHSSNKLLPFQFINPDNRGSTLGFYLEGPNTEGTIGPIIELHPLYQDRYTAWSYNLHLTTWYFLTHKIANEGDSVVKQLCVANGITLPVTLPSLSSPALETLALESFNHILRLSAPAFLYFPQEKDETTYVPSLSPDRKKLIFSEYVPSDRTLPKGSRASLQWQADGFSRSFILPYFKAES